MIKFETQYAVPFWQDTKMEIDIDVMRVWSYNRFNAVDTLDNKWKKVVQTTICGRGPTFKKYYVDYFHDIIKYAWMI